MAFQRAIFEVRWLVVVEFGREAGEYGFRIPNPMLKPISTCFATELNDGQRTSKMGRWKASRKGFPTGYRRDPSAVVKINRGSLENLYHKQILDQSKAKCTLHTTEGGQPKNAFRRGTLYIIYVQKKNGRAHFLVWPARTNLEGGGSGRRANVYVHWRLRVRTPPCASVSFCLFLVLSDARRNARTQARCARLHWQKF